MHVRKHHAGSAGPYTWETDGAVLEVPDGFGEELLSIPGAGFSEVSAHQIETEAALRSPVTDAEAAALVSPEDRVKLAEDEKAAREADEKAAEDARAGLVATRAEAGEKAVEQEPTPAQKAAATRAANKAAAGPVEIKE